MYEEIMKDVYRIRVPLPRNPLAELNSYFFVGKGRSLLIDTGFNMPECRQALTEALNALNVRMEETDIYLTHMHSDHTGLVPEIATADTRVYIDKSDMTWLLGDTRKKHEDDEAVMFLAAGFPEELVTRAHDTHPGYRFAPDPSFDRYESVADDAVFSVGDYQLQVIKTPGHTPGNTCLWMEEQQVLFSGDHVLFDITPNIQKWTYVDNALGLYLDALKMIREYPAKKTFPGHQESGDMKTRVDELLAHHKARLAECLLVVQNNPGLTAHDIAGKMSWNITVRTWEEFPPAQKWFAVGEGLSHLDYLMAQNDIRRTDDHGIWRYEAV